MKLSEFPLNELLNTLVGKHQLREGHFTINELEQFRRKIEEELLFLFTEQHKFDCLVKHIKKIGQTLESSGIKAETTIEDLSSSVRSEIKKCLEELNLDMYEFSKQRDIDVLQDIISRFHTYIDQLEELCRRVETSPEELWPSIIAGISRNSKSNILFWKEIDSRFSNCLGEEADNLNIDTICCSYPDYYETLSSALRDELKEIQDKPFIHVPKIDVVDENEKVVGYAESFNTTKAKLLTGLLQSYVLAHRDAIGDVQRIKEKYDENVEDINFDLLYRKVLERNCDLLDHAVYLAIRKREYLMEKLQLFAVTTGQKKEMRTITGSDLPNIALKVYPNRDEDLKDLFDKLKSSRFIQNQTGQKDFLRIFSTSTPARPVIWTGTQAEINMFLKAMFKFQDKGSTADWEAAKRLFLKENGQPWRNMDDPGSAVNMKTKDTLLKILDEFKLSANNKIAPSR